LFLIGVLDSRGFPAPLSCTLPTCISLLIPPWEGGCFPFAFWSFGQNPTFSPGLTQDSFLSTSPFFHFCQPWRRLFFPPPPVPFYPLVILFFFWRPAPHISHRPFLSSILFTCAVGRNFFSYSSWFQVTLVKIPRSMFVQPFRVGGPSFFPPSFFPFLGLSIHLRGMSTFLSPYVGESLFFFFF